MCLKDKYSSSINLNLLPERKRTGQKLETHLFGFCSQMKNSWVWNRVAVRVLKKGRRNMKGQGDASLAGMWVRQRKVGMIEWSEWLFDFMLYLSPIWCIVVYFVCFFPLFSCCVFVCHCMQFSFASFILSQIKLFFNFSFFFLMPACLPLVSIPHCFTCNHLSYPTNHKLVP